MKPHHKLYLLAMLLFIGLNTQAQTATETATAKRLVSEGVALHDAQKYDEAIEKYKLAMKADPKYSNAYYETGFTLYNTGKGKDAIPYLEKKIELDPNAGGAYDMLGSIYDDDKQTDKAIEYYKKGIEVDPNYQRLHFNLAITYYRLKKYPEAETEAIAAIKLEPKHASSTRIYALATYNQNKRDRSLLAWCSFLLLEPQTARSLEGYKYVKSILNYGITKTDEKHVNLAISDKADINSMSMQIAVLAATSDKKGLSPIDLLSLQLASVFKILPERTTATTPLFYTNYFVKYFAAMAKTEHMPTFTRIVNLMNNQTEMLSWFKEHATELSSFDKWVQTTERSL